MVKSRNDAVNLIEVQELRIKVKKKSLTMEVNH